MSVFADHHTTKGDLSFKKDKAARSALSNINFTHETNYSATPITMDKIDPDGHQTAKGPSPSAGTQDDDMHASAGKAFPPRLAGNFEAKGTNRTASNAKTTIRDDRNMPSFNTSRLASGL